jgi:hypothetical protein
MSNDTLLPFDLPSVRRKKLTIDFAGGNQSSDGGLLPVMTQHCAMLQRNLLYTGVTRGKRLVVLVGQKKAVAIAVRNVSGRRRWSKLGEWLRPRPLANFRSGTK